MPEAAVERDAVRLFERLLDFPEAERAARAEAEAAGRPALLARVRALIEADRRAMLRTGAAAEALEAEAAVPARIGVYRIVELIGRGGMGSVYRAERDSGDFAHKVAIKIIKPGLLSEALVERFQRERQTLASLAHPHIARLYDGGETQAGSPFIVMELIEGLPLLQYAETAGLSLEARCRLFADVCAAVGFAHRNLIVHRDLTPSNMLVTPDGVVKLIDFGIARPVDLADGGGEAAAPSVASLSLTPGYAAPERMISANVTTAADIYSLGRVLERLIPEPTRDRPLRAIVDRATALDPADRHPTVDALAAEVDAWRRGFPVDSYRSGAGYRAGRFVARHRFAVGAGIAVLLLLVAALAITLRAYASAAAARDAEAARFADLRSLANYLVFDLPAMLERVAGNAEARAAMADRAQAYLTALADSASADDDLRREAGRGLVALARVQGVPGQANLGQGDRARANLERAIALLEALDGPPEVAAPPLAEALTALSMIQAHADSDTGAAGTAQRRAEGLLAGVPVAARNAEWHRSRRLLRRGQIELAILAQEVGRLADLADRLEAEIGQWPPEMREGRDAAIDRALAAHYRGYHAYFTDRLAEGSRSARSAERQLGELLAARPNDPFLLYVLMWNGYVGYGVTSGLPGEEAESRRFLDVAQRTSRRLIEIEPNDHSVKSFAGTVRQAQAEMLAAEGRTADAIALQREVVQLYESALGAGRRPPLLNRLALANVTLGNIAVRAGDRSLACSSYDAAGRAIAELVGRDELLGFVASYREGVARNDERCRQGPAGGALEPLA